MFLPDRGKYFLSSWPVNPSKDTGRAAWNTAVGTVEVIPNLIGNGVLPGYPGYVPFLNGAMLPDDDPDFSRLMSLMGVVADAGSVKNINSTDSLQNCTNRVAIVDNLPSTGNPASALPRATPIPFNQLGQIYGTKFSGWTTQGNIESSLLAGGDGTPAVVYGTDGVTGHVWNAVVQNGKVNYIDGQTGGGGGAVSFQNFTRFQFGKLP
ncbi:toxin glutamine deamidase domain-containing protein [Burkholderia gladioli]|uniref:toxin glutamine deamidase domain-containing protein n=1 Tax=Burkholderia gladioli TaxID=28095 RepID=UPI001640D194|nr:toxin glutamine deamidase domain-containing protein [Burkholderia gladioli]